VRELGLNEFLWVKRTMPITTGANRFRDDDPSSVDGLEYALEINSPRDLFDENGCHSLVPELLVGTKKVYFDGLEYFVMYFYRRRDGGDEPNQLPRLRDPDTCMPFLNPTGRF